MAPFGIEERWDIVVLHRVDEVGGNHHHQLVRNLMIHRSIFRAVPYTLYLVGIALTHVPEDIIHLVQQASQRLARHGVVRMGGIVAQVDVRQRVDHLHTQHIYITIERRVVFHRRREGLHQCGIAGANPLQELV